MYTSVRARTLRQAAEILGGSAQLGKYLNVSSICLAAWMACAEPAPTVVFLKAVDVIQEADLLSGLRPKELGDRR